MGHDARGGWQKRDPNSIPDREDPDRDPTKVHSNAYSLGRKVGQLWSATHGGLRVRPGVRRWSTHLTARMELPCRPSGANTVHLVKLPGQDSTLACTNPTTRCEHALQSCRYTKVPTNKIAAQTHVSFQVHVYIGRYDMPGSQARAATQCALASN